MTITISGQEKQTINNYSDKLFITVLIYDISKSTDTYAMLSSAHIEQVYYGIGQNGGGRFYGLHIKSNSLKQDPVTADIPFLQQLPLKGNAYQQANRERKNKQLAAEFETGKSSFVQTISDKLIKPKNEDFSDIKNALEMARKIMENPMFLTYGKNLVIISDMENDFAPKNGIDKMQPVHLGKDVNVFLVRPSDRVNIQEIIPNANNSVYVNIQDALISMFHQIKTASHE